MAPSELRKERETGTLPADFDGWDNEHPPSTLPADFEEFDHSSIPAAKSDAAKVWRAPVEQATPSATPAPNQKDRQHSTEHQVADEEKVGETGLSRRTIAIAVALCLLAIAATTVMLSRHTRSQSPLSASARPNSQSQPSTQELTTVPKPEAGSPMAETPATAVTATKAVAGDSAQNNSTVTPHIDSSAMVAQLSAPAAIRKDKPRLPDSEPTPSEFSSDSIRGLATSGSGASPQFARRSIQVMPKEVITGPLHISSAQAMSMLLKMQPPLYPEIARSVRIGGNVVLRVKVSDKGSVVSAEPTSGPKMLYNAASNAIKGWKFRPLLVSQRPVDFITDVSVNFQMDR